MDEAAARPDPCCLPDWPERIDDAPTASSSERQIESSIGPSARQPTLVNRRKFSPMRRRQRVGVRNGAIMRRPYQASICPRFAAHGQHSAVLRAVPSACRTSCQRAEPQSGSRSTRAQPPADESNQRTTQPDRRMQQPSGRISQRERRRRLRWLIRPKTGRMHRAFVRHDFLPISKRRDMR